MKKKTLGKKTSNEANSIAPTAKMEGKAPQGRPPRRKLSRTKKLDIPEEVKEEGYAYRWILDRADRREDYEAAWWEPVRDGANKEVKKASGASYLVLYRVEYKYFEEDVRDKQSRPINLLKERAKLAKKDQYSGEYVPEGHEGVVVINN